jgi:type I restriction enzyme, S subunit
MASQIRTYNRFESIVFRKTNEVFGGLSNMAPGFPLMVNGIRILTSEALYQACRFPQMPDVQRLIIAQNSPMTAKMKSKPYRKDTRKDWLQVRVNIMRWCLRVKLCQNWKPFRDLLLDTKDKPIVEESSKDNYWGAKVTESGTLIGINVLGRLLMELREELKKGTDDILLCVKPLVIPDFMLYRQTIGTVENLAYNRRTADTPSLVAENNNDKRAEDKRHASIEHAQQTSLFDIPANAETYIKDIPEEINKELLPYDSYVESGVPWLGKLPGHWDFRKFRSILFPIAERNKPDWPLLSVVREKGVIVRNIKDDNENHNAIPDDLSNYKVVHAGQFAMNKMKAWQGSYGISKFNGIVSPAYFVFNLENIEPHFFHVAVRSRAYVPFFTAASDGIRVGQWDLSLTRMKEIPFHIPSKSEQTQIARFLDYKSSQISRFIRSKKRMIELLKEQKQAVINDAVTGKIDVRTGKPYPKYKESGVEWLEKVPERWNSVKLKHFAHRIGDGIHTTPKYDDTSEIPFINGNNFVDDKITITSKTRFVKRDEYEKYKIELKSGTILLSINGTIGKLAFYRNEPVVFGKSAAFIELKGGTNSEFIYLALQSTYISEYFISTFMGTTINNLSLAAIRNTTIFCPEGSMQTGILTYIKSKSTYFNSAISKIEKEIFLMSEYRTRLIADVVTGKIDVRDIVVPEVVEEGIIEPDTTEDAKESAEEVVEAVE